MCTLGTIPAGTFKSYQIKVQVDSGTLGLIFNTATVISSTGDPNSDNNTVTIDTIVVPPAGIHGYVWHDSDGDGDWDAGEPGLNGWTVYLDDGDGAVQSNEPWFVTQNDGTHNGAFRFTGLRRGRIGPPRVPDSWRQTHLGDYEFGGVPPAHEVIVESNGAVAGGWEETEPPNFGNAPVQTIEFITPLSVLRETFDDARFVRPADEPLTAWQNLNPPLSLEDYKVAPRPASGACAEVAATPPGGPPSPTPRPPCQAFTVTNTSDETIHGWIELYVQSPGDAFLVITDDNLVPLPADGFDVAPGTDREFFVFYDQPELSSGGDVLTTYPDWYDNGTQLTPAHTFGRNDHLEIKTELPDRGVYAISYVDSWAVPPSTATSATTDSWGSRI